jgi:hypothetical protein
LSVGVQAAGTDGNGGELGPNIASRIPSRTDEDLSTVIRQGLTTAGMPAFPNLSDTESTDLVRFLRTLRPRAGSGPARLTVTLPGGRDNKQLIAVAASSNFIAFGLME